MTQEDRERWADDHGYVRGRCPACGRTMWSDTGVYECSCGWTSQPESDEEPEPEPEEEAVEE